MTCLKFNLLANSFLIDKYYAKIKIISHLFVEPIIGYCFDRLRGRQNL